jgi:hypothetical protein
MRQLFFRLAPLFAAAALTPLSAEPSARPEIVEVRKLWDKAPHNAFTDLIRFRERWYLAFREGSTHFSADGAIRILTSADGERWSDAARLALDGVDLRDPKFSISPVNTLILSTAGAFPENAAQHHQSYVFISSDGRDWTKPIPTGDPNVWMWRVTWHRERGYSIGYSTWGPPLIRLYTTTNGMQWSSMVDELLTDNYPNESALLFRGDDTAYCLLRRDKGSTTALLGHSRPPYRAWTWRDLGVRLGGPQMIRLPDNRIVVGARFHDGKEHTALAWLDLETAKLTQFLTLPSGGDNSYPGMVFHDGLLWVSYYSSHEGKAAIYLAKVKLPQPGGPAKSGWMPPKRY